MEVEVMIERHRIKHPADITALEQGRQRGREAQALVGFRQVQRLYTEAVTGNEQLLAVALPDGKGKHAIELGQHLCAPRVVALEQYLGVATGMELIAKAFQLGTQFGKVVDRTVEGHRQAKVAVDHRLRRAVRQVHDFQTAMPKGNRPLAMKPPRIRAARRQLMGNAFNSGKVRWLMVETKFTC
ncbi:hypothetical protein ALO94_200981 [Pseudomonas syringae pv. spinaceae]|uniref:LysR family transcriptional regulator n=1 Tax=Pseudomonas syringae pv. spinaceae TaxID=264459 RepID=A0A0Q0E7B1_PSESX|nr:hypothetical protein ALO94_200981 [Pseudomonas syringae pv. spinaceae]